MSSPSLPGNLTGKWHVRALNSAFDDVRDLCDRVKDRYEIRQHALKLRYWPENNPTDALGQVLDLDWCWVKELPKEKVGELRIHGTIGGHDNLRLIFFVDTEERKLLPEGENHNPTIWILYAFQKKRDDFSKAQIKVMKIRKRVVVKRFYESRRTK